MSKGDLGTTRTLLGFAACIGATVVTTLAWAESRTVVAGWPFAAGVTDQPVPEWLLDPAVGGLACPSLTRWTGAGRLEGVLADLSTHSEGSKVVWKLRPRSGAKHWSGAPLRGEDLRSFVDREFCRAVAVHFGEHLPCPAFQSSVEPGAGGGAATVSFEQGLEMGPHVLSAIPYWRKREDGEKSAVPFECAGGFAWVDAGGSPGRTLRQVDPPHRIVRFDASTQALEEGAATLVVSMAGDGAMSWGPASAGVEGGGGAGGQCSQVLDLPFFSVVRWRLDQPPVDRAEVRRALTQLLPRGELMRTGAAGLGDLVSSLISRQHGGYNSNVLVRRFNIKEGLESLGTSTGSQGSRVWEVVLERPRSGGAMDLASRVIGDALGVAGVKVRWIDAASAPAGTVSMAHGRVEMVGVDLATANMLPVFGRSVASDEATSRSLVAYARGLSEGAMRLTQLQDAHAKVYALEPMTILMQHRACVVQGSPPSAAGSSAKVAGAHVQWLTSALRL